MMFALFMVLWLGGSAISFWLFFVAFAWSMKFCDWAGSHTQWMWPK